MRRSKGLLRFLLLLTAGFVAALMSPVSSRGHEVVGEVTPLMLHANHALTFMRHGLGEKALRMVQEVYQDFEEPGRNGLEEGLKTNSLRVDRSFGANSHATLLAAINEKDPQNLKTSLELLSFLLMREKFDTLQSTFDNKTNPEKTRITIFWLGRNYFSYLLEPAMGEKDPVEEKRLDRLLDRMLYSLEDHEWDKFKRLEEELNQSIILFFKLPVSKHLDAEGGLLGKNR